MPIRSMPTDVYSESDKQKKRDEIERGMNTAAQHSGGTSSGKQYHERKEEWLKKVEPFLDVDKKTDPESDIRKNTEAMRSHPWLVFMIVAIVSALVMFMMIPVIDNFYQIEGPNNPLENLKEFISFVAPIIIVVSAIAGSLGYFRFFYAAWALVVGQIAGIVMFILTLDTSQQSLNLGVYWIILLSFAVGSFGFLAQFLCILKKKIHREISPLMFIGFAAFAAGAYIILQFTTGNQVDLVSYRQASSIVDFKVYEPAYLPDKMAETNPKLFVDKNSVSVYYGEDHYPPPPIIDFLSGIEIVQSEKVIDLNVADPEPGVVFIDIGDEVARYTQRRGRATIEWNQGDTHIILNIYSNIPVQEMFKIARAMQPALTTTHQ